jgi:mannose-6-phosphate isomerase class I
MSEEVRVIKLSPIFQSKIWGGRNLAQYFKNVPDGKIGECWLISAHSHGDTIVENEPFKGQTLSRVYKENRHLFGNDNNKEFPLLVKIIDATDDLSIQVHPNDEYARKLGESFGKEEAWLILKAPPSKKIQIGHHAKSIKEFKQLLSADKWNDLLKYFHIENNCFIPVYPGTLHSILSGTLLLEIQQSSDLTYRVYDYNRLENGHKRPLHLKEALEVINIPDNSPFPVPILHFDTKKNIIFSGKHFMIRTLKIINNYTFNNIPYYYLLIVTSGSGKVGSLKCSLGDAFILTTSSHPLTIEGNFELVLINPKKT